MSPSEPAPSLVTRRRLVLAGAALVGLPAAMAAFTVLQGHRPLEDEPVSGTLGGSALRTLEGCLRHLLPDAAAATVVATAVDAALGPGDPRLTDALRMALQVLEHSAGLDQPLRFSRLSPEAQLVLLRGWEVSEVEHRRVIFHALRRLAVFAWGCDPDHWPAIGYDGPWVNPPAVPVEDIP